MVLKEEVTDVDVDEIGGACSGNGADDGGQDVLKQFRRVDTQPEEATHHVRGDRGDWGTGTSQVPGYGPVPAREIGGTKQEGLRAALVLVLDGLEVPANRSARKVRRDEERDEGLEQPRRRGHHQGLRMMSEGEGEESQPGPVVAAPCIRRLGGGGDIGQEGVCQCFETVCAGGGPGWSPHSRTGSLEGGNRAAGKQKISGARPTERGNERPLQVLRGQGRDEASAPGGGRRSDARPGGDDIADSCQELDPVSRRARRVRRDGSCPEEWSRGIRGGAESADQGARGWAAEGGCVGRRERTESTCSCAGDRGLGPACRNAMHWSGTIRRPNANACACHVMRLLE